MRGGGGRGWVRRLTVITAVGRNRPRFRQKSPGIEGGFYLLGECDYYRVRLLLGSRRGGMGRERWQGGDGGGLSGYWWVR